MLPLYFTLIDIAVISINNNIIPASTIVLSDANALGCRYRIYLSCFIINILLDIFAMVVDN